MSKPLRADLKGGDAAGAPRIEWAPIAAIRPNPKNARTHSRKQIRQIVTSIKKFGFLNPLIVDENEAMRSDARAMKLLLALVDRYAETTEAKVQLGELLAEDRAILAQYLFEPKASAGELSELVNSQEEGDDD